MVIFFKSSELGSKGESIYSMCWELGISNQLHNKGCKFVAFQFV